MSEDWRYHGEPMVDVRVVSDGQRMVVSGTVDGDLKAYEARAAARVIAEAKSSEDVEYARVSKLGGRR